MFVFSPVLLCHQFTTSILSYLEDVLADGIQVSLNGVIKGCGRQFVVMPIVVVAYWIVGVPVAYYIAFVRHDGTMSCSSSWCCGDVALVAGYVPSTSIFRSFLFGSLTGALLMFS